MAILRYVKSIYQPSLSLSLPPASYSHISHYTTTHQQKQDLGNGYYWVSMVPHNAGINRLFLLLKSIGPTSAYTPYVASHIANSPYQLVIQHNVAYGPTCTTVGPGISTATVGYQTSFYVTTYDQWNNRVLSGSYNLSVVALAAQQVHGVVVNYGNGTSLVLYTPHSSGLNRLVVRVNGRHVRGSPFQVNVMDGDNKANTSIPTGEGLYTAMAGVLAPIHIQVGR